MTDLCRNIHSQLNIKPGRFFGYGTVEDFVEAKSQSFVLTKLIILVLL